MIRPSSRSQLSGSCLRSLARLKPTRAEANAPKVRERERESKSKVIRLHKRIRVECREQLARLIAGRKISLDFSFAHSLEPKARTQPKARKWFWQRRKRAQKSLARPSARSLAAASSAQSDAVQLRLATFALSFSLSSELGSALFLRVALCFALLTLCVRVLPTGSGPSRAQI